MTILIIIVVLGSVFLILVGVIIGLSIHFKRKQKQATVEKIEAEDGSSRVDAIQAEENLPKKGINLANEDEYRELEDMLRNEMK